MFKIISELYFAFYFIYSTSMQVEWDKILGHRSRYLCLRSVYMVSQACSSVRSICTSRHICLPICLCLYCAIIHSATHFPVSAGLAVAGLAQAQVGVAAPVMSQPGIATPTVYSISSSQPSLAQHQYTQQQVALAGVQVSTCLVHLFKDKSLPYFFRGDFVSIYTLG